MRFFGICLFSTLLFFASESQVYATNIEDAGINSDLSAALEVQQVDLPINGGESTHIFHVNDSIYINGCTADPEHYSQHALNLVNKVIEVPNVIAHVSQSPYGRPIRVRANSSLKSEGGQDIFAELLDFRNLTIKDSNGNVLYKRKISGATSLYEIRNDSKVIGWGVGWDKNCGKYYKSLVDMTAFRVFVPVVDASASGIKIMDKLISLAMTQFVQESDNTVVIVDVNQITSGARGCYYCLPSVFIIDPTQGFVEVSELQGLKAVGITIDEIGGPVLYMSWLSQYNHTDKLSEYILTNYDDIAKDITNAFMANVKMGAYIAERDGYYTKSKLECLETLEKGILQTPSEVGIACFPELEADLFFRSAR